MIDIHNQCGYCRYAGMQVHVKIMKMSLISIEINAFLYNSYTESIWTAAVKSFENHMRPSEERVGGKLKMQFKNVNTNTLQVC